MGELGKVGEKILSLGGWTLVDGGGGESFGKTVGVGHDESLDETFGDKVGDAGGDGAKYRRRGIRMGDGERSLDSPGTFDLPLVGVEGAGSVVVST